MEHVDGAVTAKVAEILGANPDGISRAGLLAWARLRISPDFTEGQLDAALAELGPTLSIESGLIRPISPSPASSLGQASVGVGQEAIYPHRPGSMPAGAGSEPSPGVGPSPGAGPAHEPAGGSNWSRWGVPEAPIPPGTPPGLPPSRPDEWTAGRPLSRLARGGISGLALLAILALAVIGRSSGDGGSPGSTTIPSDSRGSIVPADTLSVGQCFVVPTASQFSEVEVRPCDAPHDGEVFLVWDYAAGSGAEYPTDSQWQSAAADKCEPAFGSYTGRAYLEQSELDYGWFTPSEGGWSDGDRMVQCYLGLADGGPVSRSYRAGF